MKRTMLTDQWKFLAGIDMATLNVGAGTIDVVDDKDVVSRHKLLPLYVQLIKHAYERGLKHEPL